MPIGSLGGLREGVVGGVARVSAVGRPEVAGGLGERGAGGSARAAVGRVRWRSWVRRWWRGWVRCGVRAVRGVVGAAYRGLWVRRTGVYGYGVRALVEEGFYGGAGVGEFFA
ncbi:hypothetical protein GCM10022235_52880 [Kribbella ginsengisoli]|uniref:Uncharacterized protein n=1 Tax=Kribbella ginsengisoli TaxID=363865 RepID=A0ABP6Y4W8_9ACTN